MSETPSLVTVVEVSGAAYAQTVTIGRHALTADEPVARGGQDAGPSPYDLLLAGLGACTVITIRMFVQRHNWPLIRTTVDLGHEKVPSGSGTMTDHFSRVIHFEGELTEEQRARLLQVSEHCPVSETLRHAASVDTKLADP